MEQHTTVEMDHSGFEDLRNQMMTQKQIPIPEQPSQSDDDRQDEVAAKTYRFVKGDKSFEIDEDAEIEFMADKRPMKLSLRELRDRAAGDIAVKNRMHALAEEKKRVQGTLKEFVKLSKDDPLAALEYISNKAKEADGEFEYNKYLEMLADQAEKLGRMDEKDRKALELEKKLSKANEDLSLNERKSLAILRKQELLESYPEIGNQQLAQMVDAVLDDESLLDGVEDEKGVLDRVEELIQETLIQRDILTVIEEINPSYMSDNSLIFSLSDQIRQNPDLDEDDIREIIGELITPERKAQPQRDNQREIATRTLSNKVRDGTSMQHLKASGTTDFDRLKVQLEERKQELQKTPIYKR